MSNLITVIVPIYNAELYLNKCLESLVSQTVPFDEIILINDGSTDRSHLICERFCEKYPYIHFVSQANKGQGAARNWGIRQAEGDYIIFVDSDDYIDLQFCEKIKAQIKLNDLDVLYFNARIQYDVKTEEAENAFRHLDSLNNRIMTGMEYFKTSFPGNYVISVCVAVYSKCFLEKYNILFPEGIYYEDHYFCIQVVTNAERVMCIPDSLYIRRCREDSTTTGEMNRKRCCDLVESQRIVGNYLFINRLWISNPDLLRRFVAQMVLNAFYNISRCSDKCIADEQRRILTELFLEKGLILFEEARYAWSEGLVLILISKECDHKLIEKYYGTTDRFVKCQKKAKLVLKNEFIQKLSIIPLNKKEAKVGIYGTGKHTESFMELYEQHFGEIKCELFFVVTSCEKEMSYCGRPVVSCHEIPKDVDRILLSSMPYQREMQTNLLHQGIDENKIVALYGKNDICDLIKVNWVFHEIK